MIEHALQYVYRGWHVFPLQPGTKTPLGSTRGHLDASNDPAQVQAWWAQVPTANIGIAVKPSGLTVLDVDVGEGKGGYKALGALNTALGGLAPTLTAWTPSGGLHAVYARPEGCPAKRKIDFLHRLVRGEPKGSGLDLLGDGYFVAAPSKLRDGRAYRWNDIAPIAPLPSGLASVYHMAPPTVPLPADGDERVVSEGGRDNALFRLACALRDTGITEDAIHAACYMENQQRCKPPLEDHEVSRIIESTMARVVPTRDVLGDARFETIFGTDRGYSLEPREGFRSLALDQLANTTPPPIHWRPSGWPELDKAMGGGFAEHNVTLVIAPPGAGKSSWVLQQAMRPGKPGLYISTELSVAEVRARLAAVKIGVPASQIMAGRVAEADVKAALAGPQLWTLGRDELPRESLDQVLAAIRTEIQAITDITGFAPTVYVDYLQDIARRVEVTDSSNPIGKVSMALRDIGQASGCPMIVVSSTARQWYGQRDEIKEAAGFLGAAKGDGDLDFDAANVLYLDVMQDTSRGYKCARIAAAKTRHGPGGFVGARYYGAAGGRWEQDASALAEFDKDHKIEKKKTERKAGDHAAVLKRVRERGADPKRVLMHNCGIPQTRAKNAIEELLAEGRLEVRQESRVDRHHRMQKVDVVGLPGAVAQSKDAISVPTSRGPTAQLLHRSRA